MREDLTEVEREGAGIDGEARRIEELERENDRLREALAATQAEAKRLPRDLGQRYAIPIAPAMIRPPRRRGDRESAIDLAAEIARARDAAALAAEQHELALAASQAHLNLVQTANAILATSEARLRLALAAGRLGTWELVPSTREFVASAICKANFGRRPEEPFLYDDLVASIHPDDVEYQRGEVEQSVEAEREFDIEYRCRWPDRTVHWANVRGDVVADPDGAKRLIGVSVEVTDRREAEERNKIFLHELNHRVKNTLATIQSIASQTGRNATSREEFLQAFELRLLAISKTHKLLTLSEWRGADL
jgi:two-component sensor histidine kinase